MLTAEHLREEATAFAETLTRLAPFEGPPEKWSSLCDRNDAVERGICRLKGNSCKSCGRRAKLARVKLLNEVEIVRENLTGVTTAKLLHFCFNVG